MSVSLEQLKHLMSRNLRFSTAATHIAKNIVEDTTSGVISTLTEGIARWQVITRAFDDLRSRKTSENSDFRRTFAANVRRKSAQTLLHGVRSKFEKKNSIAGRAARARGPAAAEA